MDRNFYAELEKVLREDDAERQRKKLLTLRFLNNLEECVNSLTRQASGTKACAWGMKDGSGQFVKSKYQTTLSGFDFELQISFYNDDRHAIFCKLFSFSANLDEDSIQVTHNGNWATVGIDSHYDTPSSLKAVADLLDKSLRQIILESWDPETDS